MQVQITSDWVSGADRSSIEELEKLISNLDASDAWRHGCNSTDMRQELASRGWYEGTCDLGRYLVLNLDKLRLEYRDPAMDEETV